MSLDWFHKKSGNIEAGNLQSPLRRASRISATRQRFVGRTVLLVTCCGCYILFASSSTKGISVATPVGDNSKTNLNVTLYLTPVKNSSRIPSISPSPLFLGPTPTPAASHTTQPETPQPAQQQLLTPYNVPKPYALKNSTIPTVTQPQRTPSNSNYTAIIRASPINTNNTTQKKPSSNSTGNMNKNNSTNSSTTFSSSVATPTTAAPRTRKPSKTLSVSPTADPTIPTDAPTTSLLPTSTPSNVPTFSPSYLPTTPSTSKPTLVPIKQPSSAPTNIPSFAPTLNETSSVIAQYQQTFNGNSNLTNMNDTQIRFFQSALQNYTYNYTGYQSNRITTLATVTDQLVTINNPGTPTSRRMQTTNSTANAISQLFVRYSMEWLSNLTNVSNSPLLFESWMKNTSNSAAFIETLNEGGGLDLDPYSSIFSVAKSQPTSPPTPSPTFAPTAPVKAVSNSVTVIVAAVVGIGCTLIVGGILWFFYVRRRRRKKQQQQEAAVVTTNIGEHYHKGGGPFAILESTSESPPHQQQFRSMGYINNSFSEKDMMYMLEPTDAAPSGITQQEEALDRRPSMVSASLEDDYPTSDEDDSYILEAQNAIIDEFDRYRNQDLEKMREEVKGNVDNMDGMMSQALTKVLMEQDEHDTKSLLWGASAPGDSAEIEASVLCETHDWLKRKEDATLEERNAFMQELLNRMVATVRYNYIPPEKGSRAIHGAAAMLGLQLAGDLPETAILVSGMRHKAEKKDLIEAFKVFGEIEDAAVAPNFRGFGLVRFLSPKAVQRATERYRTDRIDVQDVSVNVRVLSAPASSLPPPAEVTRQLSSGQLVPNSNASVSSTARGMVPQPARNPAERRTDRGRGVMESNMLPHLELNTIGYPSDSLGRINDSEKSKRALRITVSSDGGSVDGRSRTNSKDPAANSKDYP